MACIILYVKLIFPESLIRLIRSYIKKIKQPRPQTIQKLETDVFIFLIFYQKKSIFALLKLECVVSERINPVLQRLCGGRPDSHRNVCTTLFSGHTRITLGKLSHKIQCFRDCYPTYDIWLESLGPWQYSGTVFKPFGHHHDDQKPQECPPNGYLRDFGYLDGDF